MQELLDDIFTEKEYLQKKRNRILIGGMWGQLLFALFAIALAVDDIETIIGTGPIGSVIGLIVFGLAYKFDFPRRKKIGLSAPIFSAFCFLLIYFQGWSPGDAYIPIITLMVLYALCLFLVVLVEMIKSNKKKAWDKEILDT